MASVMAPKRNVIFKEEQVTAWIKWNESEVKVTYDQVWWPILRICALQLTYPKCTHTHTSEYTHTVNTHLEQWAAIHAVAPREQLGVQCLAQGHLVVVLKVERALYIHSPHLQFLLSRDSNSQPLDYESDSLTIRPQLPLLNINTNYFYNFSRNIH